MAQILCAQMRTLLHRPSKVHMKYFHRCGFKIDGLNFVETNAVHYHRVTVRVCFQLLEATVEINAIVTVATVAEADRPHRNFILILIGTYNLHVCTYLRIHCTYEKKAKKIVKLWK